jgi:hypothetical protein
MYVDYICIAKFLHSINQHYSLFFLAAKQLSEENLWAQPAAGVTRGLRRPVQEENLNVVFVVKRFSRIYQNLQGPKWFA